MNKKVVLISGRKQSGKDTAAEFLIEELGDRNILGRVYSFATPLKNFLIDVMGLSYEQCWGSDNDKNTSTSIKWKDLPLPKDVINSIYYKSTQNFSHDLNEYMTARQVMETFGTHICRKMSNNCWAEAARKYCIGGCLTDVYFITDARFPNEIEVFSDMNPVVVRLLRDPFHSQTDIETALDNFDFSKFNGCTIDNSNMSIEEKNECLKNMVLPLLLKETV